MLRSNDGADLRDGDETQRAHYTARRKEVREALHPEPSVDYGREDGEEEMGGTTCPTHPETDALGRKKSPQQTRSFAAETAAITGQSKRDINRNIARAEAIGDDLLRLKGTSLDKGVEPPPCKRYSDEVLRHGAMRAR